MGLFFNNPFSSFNIFKAFKDDLPRVTEDKQHAAGAVKFTPEDIQQLYSNPNAENRQAYAKLVETMAVSIRMDDESSGPLDVYPKSQEDAQRMDALLDEAESVVNNPNDGLYHKMITELRGIVGWALKRHYNCSAALIIGSMITLVGMLWVFFQNKSPYDRAHDAYTCVKQWTDDPDAPAIKMPDYASGYTYESPTTYRDEMIERHQKSYDEWKGYLEKNKKALEKATDSDKKAKLEESIERCERFMKEDKEVLDALKGASLKDVKKFALKETRKKLHKDAKLYYLTMFLFFFTVVLIPLYIYSSHAWGYNIARYREEDKVLTELRHAGYKFAVAMVGMGLATKFVPDREIITEWSDGTRTRQTEINDQNFMALGKVVICILIGLIVLGIVSTFIMLYCTITGFHRNYVWAEEKAKWQNFIQQTKEYSKSTIS